MYKFWYDFFEVMRMDKQLQWSAFVEKYTYTTKEAQQLHKKEMKAKGYEDTGLSVYGTPGKDGIYRRVLAGEYRKYKYRRSQPE